MNAAQTSVAQQAIVLRFFERLAAESERLVYLPQRSDNAAIRPLQPQHYSFKNRTPWVGEALAA
jgi:hypothetical protein